MPYKVFETDANGTEALLGEFESVDKAFSFIEARRLQHPDRDMRVLRKPLLSHLPSPTRQASPQPEQVN